MSEKNDHTNLVRSGFSAQQFVLIIATFLLGLATATVFNELLIERGFGPASVVAAHDTNESE